MKLLMLMINRKKFMFVLHMIFLIISIHNDMVYGIAINAMAIIVYAILISHDMVSWLRFKNE